MISNSLKNFYVELSRAKGKETSLELLNLDGKVILDTDNFANPEDIEKVNCFNNPIYFLDKVRVPLHLDPEFKKITYVDLELNIGTYLAIRNLMNGKNVVLELPPQSKKSTIAKAYALYLLLFTDKYIVVNPNRVYNRTSLIVQSIIEMYNGLPEYLKVKSVENIKSRIIADSKKTDYSNIGLCIYDDLSSKQVDKLELDVTLPTLICDRLDGEDRWGNKLISALTSTGTNNFVQVRYNMFDLGETMKDAENHFKRYNSDLSTFLKEYVL